MNIDKSKIKVTLPEGLEQVGEIKLEENKGTVTVRGTQALVNGEVKVAYDKSPEVSATISVLDMVSLLGDKTGIDDTQSIKITATFNVKPELAKYEMTLPEGFTVVSEPAIEGETIVATYRPPRLVGEDVRRVTFTATYDGLITKDLSMKVLKKPANVFRNMTKGTADGLEKNQVVVDCIFLKDLVGDETLEFVLPEHVTKVGELTYSGKVAQQKLAIAQSGKFLIKATYDTGKPSETTRAVEINHTFQN